MLEVEPTEQGAPCIYVVCLTYLVQQLLCSFEIPGDLARLETAERQVAGKEAGADLHSNRGMGGRGCELGGSVKGV